jgi:flagellar basal body-associated protein FliL
MFDTPMPRPGNLPPQPQAGPRPASPLTPVSPPLSSEPEDIFAGVDKGGAGMGRTTSQPPMAPYQRQSRGKRILLVILIVIVILLLVSGGVLAYLNFFQPQIVPPTNLNANLNANVNANANVNLNANVNVNANANINDNLNANANTNANVNTNVNATPIIDSDNDGLSDEQEQNLGTNPLSADTDNDGLFDKEEIEVYHTNPLDPDTDKDGFKDGEEIRNGYNPNGPGKLLVPPQG